MCGLFAFAGESGALDKGLLAAAALQAMKRGPHGWGLRWHVPGEGPGAGWFERRSREKLAVEVVEEIPDAADVVLGHCRLATSGDLNNLLGYQPLTAGPPENPTSILHNGNVREYRWLADSIGLKRETDSDSEVIALLIERVRQGRPDALGPRTGLALRLERERLGYRTLIGDVTGALANLDQAAPIALVAARAGGHGPELVACRRSLPLWRASGVLPRVEYVCSRPFGQGAVQVGDKTLFSLGGNPSRARSEMALRSW